MENFLHQHDARLRVIADTDGAALAFLPRHLEKLRLLQCLDLDEEFERQFAVLMERRRGIGVYTPTHQLIRSASFQSSPNSFVDQIPSDMAQELGWTEAELDDLRQFFDRRILDDLYARGRAAIGRLCSHPRFLADVYALQKHWRELSDTERPPFPLFRPPAMPEFMKGSNWVTNRRLQKFGAQFTAFLDHWQLAGMTTWDIPEPMDFHPEDVRKPQPHVASVVTTVTGLIVVDQSDGRISDAVRAQHRQFREEQGLTDLESNWKCYATIGDIVRWELALTSRLKHKSKPLSQNKMSEILAELLPRDVDHVRRLRRVMKHLRSGGRDAFPQRKPRKKR